MIIYTKEDATIVIPCGLGPVVCPDVSHDLQMKQVDPSTSALHVEPDQDFYGLSSVTVQGVTSSIDPDIRPENIKKDVEILGVTGTYESSPVLQDASLSYTQNGTYTLNASSGYDGLGTVTVDVSVAGSGGSDWVLAAKAGTLTDLSPYHIGYDVLSKDYAMYNMFYRSNMTNPPNIDSSVIAFYAMSSCFSSCKSITSISFPNLVTINGHGMQDTFYASGITSASFPKLTTVGISGMIQCFYGCSSLTSVSFPKLTTIQFRGSEGCLSGCTNLQNVEINPAAISMTSDAPSIRSLTLTATVTDNLSVSALPNLIADSVLDIIEHLSLSVSGKTLAFYSSGLTVTDYPDGRIQAACDTALNAGWTINNLTITPYS